MTKTMLQKNLGCYFKNQGPNLFLINPNGSMKEQKMNKFSSSYLCLIVFIGTMEPLSSLELSNFSNNISKFQDLDCKLVGLSRDSPMVLQD
jgi:peroxiredoxin